MTAEYIQTSSATEHEPASLNSADPRLAVQDKRGLELSAVVAYLSVALLGLNVPIAFGMTTSTLIVICMAPVWISALSRFRFAVPIMVLTVIAVVWGVLLVNLNTERGFEVRMGVDAVFLLIAGIGGLGLLLWARTVLPVYQIVVLFGSAYLLSVLSEVPGSENPWKYQLSIPVSLIVLALASRSRSAWPTLLSLGAIGLLSIATNSRSFFGFCLLAAVMYLWQRRSRRSDMPMNKLLVVGLIGLVLAAMYSLGTSLLAGGYLGEEAQTRTVAQIQDGGTLLAGGRPEWFATSALMAEHPMGFGIGAVPTATDIWVAKTGIKRVGIETTNGYVDNYMFGGHIKLHSIIADLWASFGLVGLALGLFLGFTLVFSLLDRIANATASGLACLFAIIGIWDLAFGPIFTNLKDVMIAVAIALPLAVSGSNRKGAAPLDPSDVHQEVTTR